ncbi:MAG: hypothetical protein ACJATF_002599 [Flavobacteriales bacterium]|jgi:hypothetical protein
MVCSIFLKYALMYLLVALTLFILFHLLLAFPIGWWNTGYKKKNNLVLYAYQRSGQGISPPIITIEVLNADFKTFEKISSAPRYGIDKFHSFYEGKLIENSIGESFQLLEHGYSKDKFQVYFEGELVVGADPATFKVIDYRNGQDSKFSYSGKDKKSV